jgi:cytochrome c6
MKKLLELFSTAAFVCFCVFAFASHMQFRVVDAQDVDGPRELFLVNCARCHGADGKSKTRLGITLEAADLTSRDTKRMSLKKMTRVVARGRGAMPAFGKKLKPEEIASVVSYIRTL